MNSEPLFESMALSAKGRQINVNAGKGLDGTTRAALKQTIRGRTNHADAFETVLIWSLAKFRDQYLPPALFAF